MARLPRRRRRRARQDARRFLLSKLLDRANATQVRFPATVSTPYVNTIPREKEPWFPGDEYIERRIRAFVRWNAAAMVVRANKKADGIGGHLSTFASSASLYEIGFNHFFHGKDDGIPGDHVYFQGHAAPGRVREGVHGRTADRRRPRPLPSRDRSRWSRAVELPAPAADARLLGVPDGQHGPRAAQRAVPGPVQPLPAEPRARRHQPEPDLGVPRRRRVRRAGDARRAIAGKPREARQPHLRRQLQPAAPRRARSAATARSSKSSRPCSAAWVGTSSR
jgi:hypothetical protein